MTRVRQFLIAAIVLAAALHARAHAQQPTSEAVSAPGFAVLEVPVGDWPTRPDELVALGPDRELELRGLPGELLLARLGYRPTSQDVVPEFSTEFEGEQPTWMARASFITGRPGGNGGVQTVWLAAAIPLDAVARVYEGHLVVRVGQGELRAPLIVTISSGRLDPSTTRYLVLSSALVSGAAHRGLELEGAPAVWPLKLPITSVGLEEQNGDVTLDLSKLDALVEELAPGAPTAQPLPVFLAPLMGRLCTQFEVEPLRPTYVLALHSLLAQLRDWAEGKGVSLVFVPPIAQPGDDPDGLGLEQHVLILRETPGIRVLLPAEPLLTLKRPQQRRLLSLAQAYLVQSPNEVTLVSRHGVEGTPIWLQAPPGRRLEAGFWARAVGARVVLIRGASGPDDCLEVLSARTDARYFDTLSEVLNCALETGDPTAQRVAQQAQALLNELSRDVEKAVRDRDTEATAAGEEAERWRAVLRHDIDGLAHLLK